MKQLLEEAKRLIRINSVSSNGNEELSNFVHKMIEDRGMKAVLQPVTHSLESISKRQFNVIGILGDPLVDKKTRKGLLLLSHLDTVDPGLLDNWTETAQDPFAATVREGRVYGLGVAEGKIDFLCKLYAIDRYRERKLKMPVYLVGTCGAEQGMFGAKYLIKSMALNPKYVLVGEPTDLHLVRTHKCMAVFRASIDYQLVERDARGFNRRIDLMSFGRAAHGSTPNLGENAILQAVDFLQHAVDSGFDLRFTRMEGGNTKNKVPDRARIEFYLTSHQFEDFKRFFRETAKAQGKEKAFRAELGGLGDTGVRFLPDTLYPCFMELIQFLRTFSEEVRGRSNPAFEPSHATINLGQVQQRPTGMDLFFEVRLLPDHSTEEVEKRILQGVQAIAARYPNMNVTAQRERTNPALDTPADREWVKVFTEALAVAGLPTEAGAKSTSTEAALFQQAGYDALVFGPGAPIGNSHGPNEHLLLEQIDRGIAFYSKLIEKVCL